MQKDVGLSSAPQQANSILKPYHGSKVIVPRAGEVSRDCNEDADSLSPLFTFKHTGM